jgi:molecular chaperone GrpE
MSGQENDIDQEETNEVIEQVAEASENAIDQEENPAVEATDVEHLQQQLEKEKEKAQANLDIALRAQAEMDNLRKRTARDIENAHK